MENKNELNRLAMFNGQKIRRVLVGEEWWFSVVDVVRVLTDSPQPKTYWAKIKERELGLSQSFPFWEQLKSEVYNKIVQLKLEAADGKKYATDCANTEGLFRIIQSIPSPKAEPFGSKNYQT